MTLEVLIILTVLFVKGKKCAFQQKPKTKGSDCVNFDYSQQGADWTGTCSTGTSQSPINIDTSSATFENLGEFTFTNYEAADKHGNIKNNGHTIQIDMADTSVTISGGGLSEGYTLAQYHLHWGSSSSVGSEHTINNNQHPLEIHFVHYKTSQGNIDAAVSQSDGLAVLGFVFQIDASDNPDLNFITGKVEDVMYKDNETTLDTNPAINSIFSNVNTTKYTRYNGSLTTPGCNEAVVWTVFIDPILISENQMNLIRAAKDNDTDDAVAIGNNYRAVQSLQSREVKISYTSTMSAGQHVNFSKLYLVLACLVSFLSRDTLVSTKT